MYSTFVMPLPVTVYSYLKTRDVIGTEEIFVCVQIVSVSNGIDNVTSLASLVLTIYPLSFCFLPIVVLLHKVGCSYW